MFLEMIPNIIRPLLNEIFYLGSRSPILVHHKVQNFLQQYQLSEKSTKIALIEHIAKEYHPDETQFRTEVRSRLDATRTLFDLHRSKNSLGKTILFVTANMYNN